MDLFFPHHCTGCSRPWQLLCDDCYEQLDFCLPLPKPRLSPCYLDEIKCCLELRGITRRLIHDLKYFPIPDLAYICGQLLAERFSPDMHAVITAVPLHPNRHRQRGFNQAEMTARCFATLSHCPYQDCLVRTAFSQPQAQMQTKQSRLQNVADHFAVVHELTPSTVIIIDDVYTTGATLNECAKVLKQHGTKRVIGMTVAHGQ